MKKRIISLVLTLVMLIAVVPARAEAAQNVSATVASFKVTLNGVVMDNDYAQYPLIVYKDITYFPMTYYDCRFMAVKTDWNQDTQTLSINAAGEGEQYHPTTRNDKNPKNITASIVEYNVIINGKKIDNLSEPYPLLSFRDVTYFPMTWRFCVDEFGWSYSYTQESGLIVDSGKNSTPPENNEPTTEPSDEPSTEPSVPDSVGLEYELTKTGTYTVIGIGTCTDTHIVIPEVYQDKKVTAIAARAFYNCSTIEKITIPASVTSIGTQIFFKADSLHTVYYNSTYSPTDNPFLNQKSIKKVVFGGKSVPENICRELSNIEEVVIMDGVTGIGSSAFKDCINLTKITIADSVTKIGGSAFKGCTSLTGIVIPVGVTSIGSSSFYDCRNLTTITIPDTVISIGSKAFWNCTSLTNITIPDSVTSISKYLFWNCTSLTEIIIPDSVTSIGDFAFNDCTSLTSIFIPSSVATIDNYAFSDCKNLNNITYDGTMAQWKTICKNWSYYYGEIAVHCTDGDVGLGY